MLHQVGVGVMGPVYRTYEPDRDRLVAVKVFRLDITPEQARTLADELSYLVSLGLSHPAIVSPLSAGVEGTVPFFAQDYVAAESLDVAMRHIAPAPAEKALPLIRQIADAIDAARAAGVLHGSLHPRDIFVTPDQVRITGFGVAPAIEHLGLRAPIRRPYSAPERVAGQPWRAPADIYSLAAIAHELLTGRRVAGPGERAAAILASLGLKHLEDVFVQALAEDPGVRFSSAAGFMAALTRGSAQPPLAFDETEQSLAGAWPVASEARADTPDDGEEGADDLALRMSADDGPLPPSAAPASQRWQKEEAESGGFTERPWDLGEPDSDADTRFPREIPVEAPTDERLETGGLGIDAEGGDNDDRLPGFTEEPAEGSPALLDASDDEDAFGAEAAGRFGPTPQLTSDSEPFAEDDVPRREDPPVLPHQAAVRSRPHMLPHAVTAMVALLVGFLVGYSLNLREATTTGAPAAAEADGRTGSAPLGAGSEPEALAIDDIGTAGPGVRPEAPPGPPPTVPEEVPALPGTGTLPPSTAPDPAQRPAGAPAAPRREPETRAPAASRPATPAPPPAAAAEGRMLVRSSPAGAVVRVNNVQRGATPLALRELAYGSYTVQVSLPGYAPQSRRVTISAARPAASFEFTLQPVRARAADAPAPPAARPTGTTEQRAVTARASEPASAGRPGSLFIDSQPRGAWVFIGGRSIGTTPMLLSEIRAGLHDLRIEHEGYQAWTAGVRIASGERQTVTASLRPQR